MSQSLFQYYVLGGGWSMLLLVPLSIVAIASFLQATVTLWGGGVRRLVQQVEAAATQRARTAAGTPVSPAAEATLLAGHAATRQYALLQPLSFAYAVAPVIGALGTVWALGRAWRSPVSTQAKVLQSALEHAFIPLGWGLLISLVSIVMYSLLKARLYTVEQRHLLPAAYAAIVAPAEGKPHGRKL